MITNKINTILNNSQQGDIDYTICNYIKMNLKEVAFMSIEELARKSYVSKAKISKFIKKLGYDNYIAFKDDCLLEQIPTIFLQRSIFMIHYLGLKRI